MTIEAKINKIIEKINNDDYNFNKEELFLLEEEEILTRMIIKKLVEKEINIPGYDLSSLVEKDYSFLTPDETADFLINLFHIFIYDMGTLYYDDIDGVIAAGEMNEKNAKRVHDLVEKALRDPNCHIDSFECNDLFTNKLLDYKRYDILKHFYNTSINKLSNETCDRILREYPFETAGIPEFFLSYYQEHTPVYDQTLESLLGIFNRKKVADIDNNFDPNDLRNAIISKLYNANDLKEFNNDSNLSQFIASLEEPAKTAVSKMAYSKGFYIDYYREALRQKESHEKIVEFLIDHQHPFNRNDIYDLSDGINLNNPKIANYFVETGCFDSLITFDEISLEPIMPAILANIKTNPNYKEKFESIVNYEITKYKELLSSLISNGIVDNIYLPSGKYSEEIEDILLNGYRINPKYSIKAEDCITNIPKYLKTLLEYEKYEEFFSSTFVSYGEYEKYDKDLYPEIEKHMGNAFFANRLLTSCFESINLHPELLDHYYGKRILNEKLLDYINHHEELDNLYSHDAFIKMKTYLAKKYKLNEGNLSLIESKLGPLVLRYIDNENLHQIINLPTEELNKLIGLFPQVEFTLQDLNAAYDSIIQYNFGKENPATISIFADLLHAAEDHNTRVIEKIKEVLVYNTNISFLIKILEKHRIVGIEDIGSLIDLIVYKLDTDESERYKEILHDLTNEYILSKRTYYRNYNYFDKQYPAYKEAFKELMDAIKEKDQAKIDFLTKEIVDSLDNAFFTELKEKLELPDELDTPDKLMNFVVHKIATTSNNKKYMSILHELTDHYHSKMRDEHSKEIGIAQELELPYTLDERSTNREVIRYLIAYAFKFYDETKASLAILIQNKLAEQGIQKDLIVDCLKYYSKSYSPSFTGGTVNDFEKIKETLPLVVRTATKIINEIGIENFTSFDTVTKFIPRNLDRGYVIKRNYTVDKTSIDIYQLLIDLNLTALRKSVLNNEQTYNTLLAIMKKRKPHLLPDSLKKLLEVGSISTDYTNISGFVSFFDSIYESERSRLAANGKNPDEALSGLASILIQAEIHSGISSVYSQVLGGEDAKLIKANPRPNSSSKKIKNNERLIEAIKLTKENYLRREVTVPTFDRTFNLTSGKQLEVTVGNFTDPSNLTHGERTGACMRIGGVGESLFYFCLKNPNGFHIRFNDPETGEYISRVSGFRNGNTVFLNELRYSCNPSKFDDDEVIEACKKAANELIRLSAGSTCPIENVVISDEYAMRKDEYQLTNLGVQSIKEGLPSFYTDVSSKAVILATTTPPFKPINFDKTEVPTYEPCRSKVIRTQNQQYLSGRINRVASIKAILEGVPYENLDQIEFEDGLIYGIVADDWYIYITRNMEIKYDYIPVDPRAKEELTTHLAVIEEMINRNEIKEEAVYGL